MPPEIMSTVFIGCSHIHPLFNAYAELVKNFVQKTEQKTTVGNASLEKSTMHSNFFKEVFRMPEGDLALINSLQGVGNTASFKLNRLRVRIQIPVN